MEEVSARFPYITQLISKNLEQRTLVNFKESSRKSNQILDHGRFYWIRILNKYNNHFAKFHDAWRKVIFQAPIHMLKKLALTVDKYLS